MGGLGGYSNTLAFTFIDSSNFDLRSVDLAENSFSTEPATVQFVGYRPDGSFITTEFTTDGINDMTGPLADFQTFYFGPEFSGLTRVEIPTFGWSLDNLVIAIPEPGGGVLLLLGAGLVGRRWFSGKQR